MPQGLTQTSHFYISPVTNAISVIIVYRFIVFGFTILGASMNFSSVIGFSDAMIFAMAIPNIIGLYLLAPEVKEDLAEYLKELKSNK